MLPLGVQSVTAKKLPEFAHPCVVHVAVYSMPPSPKATFGRRAQQRELPPPQESDVLQRNSLSLLAQARTKPPPSGRALQVSATPPLGAQHACEPDVQLLGVHWMPVDGEPSVPPSVVVPVSVVPVSVVPVSFVPVSWAVASVPEASGTAATSSPPQAMARAAVEQVTRPSAIQRRLGMVAA